MRSVLEGKADLHGHLPVGDLPLDDMAAGVDYLNQWMFLTDFEALAIALFTASSIPVSYAPTKDA